MYLLDTCVISDFVKGEKGTLEKIKNSSPQEIAVSSITVMEINHGLSINPQKAKKISPIIEELLKSITILDFSTKEAYITAQIRAFLRENGTPIGAYDVLIGATALSAGLILVTANTREFQRIADLKIINWRF
ncbi:type II toxin-antitoxin system VapC family toxin [Cyanobacterium aponinum]|uniref:PilT protein domain protein n=1 Tax=Cyanobacterium aponinum (strain PCC 10605) TaxID=755178 RepID=K9Z0X7_CYAAP|nr:type II toxin-antitoxin system VapC family toxin [Cyanobacterium aponinum]AFZ52856.1 PilT protein domain protein [Cyanobacterium aponinum PCC 10605]